MTLFHVHGNPFWWLCLTSTCPIVWLPYCTWTDFQAILWCYQLWLRWYQVLLGCLNIYILGLSVMELDSFMCNFDTRRINFVEPCSSSPWLSRWMWCFLRIPHTHTRNDAHYSLMLCIPLAFMLNSSYSFHAPYRWSIPHMCAAPDSGFMSTKAFSPFRAFISTSPHCLLTP